MRIVIAGGHGQVALRLERLLHARGDEVAGIIRKPGQRGDLLAAGAEPVVCDLESASVAGVARHLAGADAADADVRGRAGLDSTILRPGRLTGDPGAGTVALAASTGRGAVPRDDVAAVIAALLDEPRTAGHTLELISGDVPVDDAVANVAG